MFIGISSSSEEPYPEILTSPDLVNSETLLGILTMRKPSGYKYLGLTNPLVANMNHLLKKMNYAVKEQEAVAENEPSVRKRYISWLEKLNHLVGKYSGFTETMWLVHI